MAIGRRRNTPQCYQTIFVSHLQHSQIEAEEFPGLTGGWMDGRTGGRAGGRVMGGCAGEWMVCCHPC